MKGNACVKIKSICKQCGKPMEAFSLNKKYCYECREIRNCEQQIKSKQKRIKVKDNGKIIHKTKAEIKRCLFCGQKFVGNGKRSYCDKCRADPKALAR